ncbi:MAG: GMC family oxidoreductase [Dongiaceae bacterium]
MLVDARTLPDGERLAFDLCIIGAGAAGITLAQALAGGGQRIALVESGGLDFDPAVQELYAGESVGLRYRLAETRLRYFGGSTNHWSGLCRPLDPLDFAERPWVPHSGWPFARGALEPFYERARPICELPPSGPTADDLRHAAPPPVAWSGALETAAYQTSPPTRFGEKYRAGLAQAPGITVLLNASLLTLETAGGGATVSIARLGTLSGLRFALAARRYVLACGGLENARLLLLSAAEDQPLGLGNRHGLVGRFFMEHPQIRMGALIYARPAPPGFDHALKTPAGTVREAFRLGAAAQQAHRTTNVDFHPLYMRDLAKEPDMAPWDTVVRSLASRLAGGAPPAERRQTILFSTAEQAPDPDSRLTLADARDAFGLRRLRLDWRLGEMERHSFATAARLLVLETGRLGIGRVWFRPDFRPQLAPAADPQAPGSPQQLAMLRGMMGWGCHHMGTTRMHADPRQGVVDPSCRVHGIDNLYVAGSSVFPTGGVSNPTLTIVALALRLADHLSGR